MSAVGHSRPIDAPLAGTACPLRPKSGHLTAPLAAARARDSTPPWVADKSWNRSTDPWWVEHPSDKARADLDAAAPILTADPLMTARVLVEQSPEREHLEGLTDGELLREAARALAIAVIVIARALMHRPETILDKTGELGLLFRALAASAVAIPAAFAQAKNRQVNDNAAESGSPTATS
jgi:hypothetical protein